MANNNTQFCFEITLNSPEEAEWVETILSLPDTIDNTGVVEDDGEKKERLLDELIAIFPEWEEYECLGFDYEISGADGPQTMCIHDNGGEGNLGFVVDFLQAYMLKFKVKGGVGFDWAETCSRSLPGQFGGGAVVVTAFSAEWTNTTDWLVRKLAELK